MESESPDETVWGERSGCQRRREGGGEERAGFPLRAGVPVHGCGLTPRMGALPARGVKLERANPTRHRNRRFEPI